MPPAQHRAVFVCLFLSRSVWTFPRFLSLGYLRIFFRLWTATDIALYPFCSLLRLFFRSGWTHRHLTASLVFREPIDSGSTFRPRF